MEAEIIPMVSIDLPFNALYDFSEDFNKLFGPKNL